MQNTLNHSTDADSAFRSVSSHNSVISYARVIRDNVLFVSRVSVWVNSLSKKYISLFAEDLIMLCETCGYRGCCVLLDRSGDYAQEVGEALIFEGFAKTKSPSHKKSDVYSYNACRS